MERSPYAPPVADVSGGGSDRPPPAPLGTVDIGAAISYPMQTPDWWMRCAKTGLFMLIPIAGMVALMGWMKQIFEESRAGNATELPELDFGRHLSDGWRPFGAMFLTMMTFYLIMGVLFGSVMALIAIVGAISQDAANIVGGIAMLLAQLLNMVMILGLNAYIVEQWRLSLGGSLYPPASIVKSAKAVMAHPMPYVMTVVGLFLASMVGSLGFLACGVGMIVTLPAAWAVMAHLVGQWSRVAEGPATA